MGQGNIEISQERLSYEINRLWNLPAGCKVLDIRRCSQRPTTFVISIDDPDLPSVVFRAEAPTIVVDS